MGFKKCSKEPSVYRKREGTSLTIVAVYVDDLFVTGSNMNMVKKFKSDMAKIFDMSDLGKLTYYLGIEVNQSIDEITIKQETYASRILKEAKLEICNPSQIPMDPGTKLTKGKEEKDIDPTNYRKFIGCLRYLLQSRPDMAYAVGVLSRYMQEPKESHGTSLKHLLRYLKGSTGYGIAYKRNGDQRLVGYSDSSHNIDSDDGRSTTGHVFYYGSSPITWCSQKQNTVALSSCEAEFMAATSAACQAIWLQELLSEILYTPKEVVSIRVDNMSAIALTKNPVFHGRSKHIHTRYHFIRECVDKGQVSVDHVSGEEQKADILTKPLGRTKFKEMRSLVGMTELSNKN